MRGIACVVLLVFFFQGCVATTTTEVKRSGTTADQVLRYQGPKARISVGNIKCTAAACLAGIAVGDGIRDMLISALFKTNRFIILGSKEELEEIKTEVDLAQTEYVEKKSAVEAGGWESADVVVLGSVTALDMNAGSLGGAVGGLLLSGFLGGARIKKNDAYIAMDLKLVDVRTRRIINTTTVEGKASSFGISGLGAGWGAVGALTGGLSIYQNTPMEKAIRVMLEKAVDYISTQIPDEYYRYETPGETTPVVAR